MVLDKVTALICAYNASKTIKRAIVSVLGQVDKIIIVDDGSIDNTIGQIESVADPKVILIKGPKNLGIGASRQIALENCRTKYAIWVDADDECLPNRVEALLPYLEQGAGWVYDSVELYDGLANCFRKNLVIPDLLFTQGGICHQLARNYIPSIGFPMVNVKLALNIGYDRTFRHGEDYDHFLRTLMSGEKIALSPDITHRMYEYPTSLSRQLDSQNAFVELAMKKQGNEQIMQFLEARGISRVEQYTILLLRLLKIRDVKGLETRLSSLASDMVSENHDLQWLVYFSKGILNYMRQDYSSALSCFRGALELNQSADICNNIGVLNEHLGESGKDFFMDALALSPGYQDAEMNLCGDEMRITYVPLRQHQSRDNYGD